VASILYKKVTNKISDKRFQVSHWMQNKLSQKDKENPEICIFLPSLDEIYEKISTFVMLHYYHY